MAFPGVFAWSPVTSAAVTASLGVDPGAWNVWRNRRLTPAPLPEAWFRRSTGSPLTYRVDHVLSWLASRHGEQFDHLDAWRQSLSTSFGQEAKEPHQMQKLARLYAEIAGPYLPGGVRFTGSGFASYLDSLEQIQ